MDHKEILRKGFGEFVDFINPFVAQRAELAGEPIRVVRATDGILYDADGHAVEDFHGTQMLGHRHPAITAAIEELLATDIPNWYPTRISPQAGRFARRLCERTGYTSAFFSCTGSDVVEAAVKLGRAVTGKPGVIALDGAYHGCAIGATALMTDGPFRDPFGPHLPGVRKIALGDVAALAKEMAKGDVGSVVVEPIQGEGGVRVLPEAFVEALCELTAKHGALLVADEIQTGLGRTGRGFLRSSVWPRRPDAALLGKGLGGGLVPTSALLTTKEIFAKAYGRDFEGGESHNVTFGYNALGMVAGLAMLDVVTDELIASVAARGAKLKEDLTRAVIGHPLVEEVRGEGFMLGIKLKSFEHPWLTFEHFGFDAIAKEGRSTVAPLLCHRLHRHGLFTFTCGHDWSVFRMQPRYFVADATLEKLVAKVREELDYLAELGS
jgi:acetylornithine/succinyldiaminopimelate/putrescine aminotransferase